MYFIPLLHHPPPPTHTPFKMFGGLCVVCACAHVYVVYVCVCVCVCVSVSVCVCVCVRVCELTLFVYFPDYSSQLFF